jgi:aldose sugar dehydrogenase
MLPRTFMLAMVITLSIVISPLNIANGQQSFEILNGRDPPEGPLPYSMDVKAEPIIKDLEGCGVTFAFLPDGRIICGELKTGKVRMIENNELLPESLLELEIYHGKKPSGFIDERGLTGLTIDPNFSNNHYVYLHWTYLVNSETKESARQVARFTLVENKLIDKLVLLDGIPASDEHVGGPLEFGPDEKLYITGGDAGMRGKAASLFFPVGKTLRINPDGSIPSDNPFPGLSYYTIGHRNVFGIAFHPITGVPYITENGNNTDDEINILSAGKNYGWPTVWGYSNDQNFVSPILSTGALTIAPTEIIFYTGDKYPSELTNNMFFLSFNFKSVYTVQLKSPNYDEVVSFQSHQLPTSISGYTEIEQGPDGYLYVSDFSSIYRLLITKQLSTKVEMSQPSATSSGSTLLSAKVLDYTGKPLVSVPLNFLASGNPVGTAITSNEGVAVVSFAPPSAGNYTISASFAGNDKFQAATSPSITFRVEEFDTSKILEATADNGFQVRLTILPSSDPNFNSSMSFRVEFTDPRNGVTLDNIPYVVEISRDGKILYSQHSITNPNNLHRYDFDQSGPAQIVIKEINNSQSSVEFAISVVPEFPIYAAMLVMLLGFIITIILTNGRKTGLFDHI